MSKTTKVVLWAIVIVVVVVGGYFLVKNPGTTSNGPIKIGWIGPLTGDAANIGLNAQAATEIAVDEINKSGGINGRQIQVVYEDGQCAGSVASNSANKLINIDKVPVILGGACSGETASFTGSAKQAKTIVFSYCSSAPDLSKIGDFFFRDYPSDTYQGSNAANYIYNTLGKKKVAVLYVQADWGTGIRAVFVDAFKKLGGTIVADEGYNQDSRDLRTQLTKIKAANPDLIYFLGYTEASTVGIKQARELGITVPLFGGDTWDDSKIWSAVGSAGDGSMYEVVYAPLNDAFKASMKSKLGKDEVTICSPQAYDAVKVLAQAIGNAGTGYDSLKTELHKTVYNGGVSSDKIQFDQNGDLIGANYAVKVVKNGQATNAQ